MCISRHIPYARHWATPLTYSWLSLNVSVRQEATTNWVPMDVLNRVSAKIVNMRVALRTMPGQTWKGELKKPESNKNEQ